jgi:transketolase
MNTDFADLNIASKKARVALLEMHHRSGTGHIGGNLSCIDMLISVRLGSFNPNKDKLVLSKGHSCGSLYIVLYLAGVIQRAELNSFYQNNTRLSGHPPIGKFAEIPFATGSLGHGASLACGMALSKKLKNDDGFVYVICSDGEWQEGASWEALGFAVANSLDNLIILIDENGLQGFGATKDVWSGSSLTKRLTGFSANIQKANGHHHHELQQAITRAKLSTNGPNIIICNTEKGHGVEFMKNRLEWHYLPMNQNQYETAIAELEL